MEPQAKNKRAKQEEQIISKMIDHMALGGTSTVSLEAAGVVLLGLAMTRIADAIERAEKQDWQTGKKY